MMWIQLCLMISFGHRVYGQMGGLVPCDGQPTSYVGPPLPTLPTQFQTYIEANIVQKNKTRNFVEYFDYPGNRGVIVSYNKTTRETMKIVMNFNEQEARIIYEGRTCRFMKTNSSTNSFGFMSAENGAHIKSVKDLLYFGEEMGETFIDGDKQVRGINVNHWRTCVKVPQMNGTFILDYYFSKGSGYSMDGSELQLPVRAVINGTGKSRHRNGSMSEEYHSFYHIYEFFDFKPGMFHSPKVFEIPVGVICNKGDLTKNVSAPAISHQFTVGMEKVVLDAGVERERQTMQIYSDFSAELLRYDVDIPIRRDIVLYGSRPLTYINDYHTGLTYVIDKLEQNCTVQKIVAHRGGEMLPPPTVLHYFFNDYSRFIYQGQKSWRGVPVDSWGFYNSSSKEITEIFFHQPQVGPIGRLDPHQLNNYVPIGLYKTGFGPSKPSSKAQEQTTYEHFFGFSNGHPDPNVFDVNMCYAKDHHSTFLALDVTGRNVGEILTFHQKEFISEVRQTIATTAKVSVTRVASLKWEERKSGGTSTRLTVTFQLLDNKLKGLADTVDTGPSLSEAINNLAQSVNSGNSLVFDLKLSTSQSVRLTILEGSLWEVYTEKTEDESKSTIKKYGSGSMAGLGLGMLLIGALLGLIAAFVIYKRTNTEVPYEISK